MRFEAKVDASASTTSSCVPNEGEPSEDVVDEEVDPLLNSSDTHSYESNIVRAKCGMYRS